MSISSATRAWGAEGRAARDAAADAARPLRVLLFGDFNVVHTRRYFEILRQAGCEIFALDKGRAPNLMPLPRGRYFAGPLQGRRLFGLFGAARAQALTERFIGAQLKLLVAAFRPDVVHVQWVDDWAWRIGRAVRRPLVLTAWGTDINQTRDPAFDADARTRIAEALSRSDLLIGDSADLLEQAGALAGRPLRTLSLPIGIDTGVFRPGLTAEAAAWRRRLAIPPGAPVILSPRALRELYGHHLIVEAFAGLAARDAVLVIKAYDCWDRSYRERLTGIAADLGVGDRLRIIDEVSYAELPALYGMADLAVNFPAMDAFPVTFLECLACGLPVVTNPLPAYERHDVASRLLFAEDRSAGALSRRLAEALANPPSPRERAEARAFVCERFDAALTARALVTAYRELAATS